MVSPADLYSALRNTGLHHGQAFAALTRIVRRSNGTSETEIVLPDEATGHRGYRIHPVLLDAALQGLAAALSSEALADSSEATYLPVSFEKIRVFGEVGRRARCRAELVNPDGDGAGIMGRVLITDETGTPTAEISGIYLQRVQRRTVPMPLDAEDLRHRMGRDSGRRRLRTGRQLAGADRRRRGRGGRKGVHRRIRLTDPTGRRADLSQESAVLEAFSQAAGDAELPPVGVVIFAGKQTFDGTDSGDAPARGRDLAWGVASTVRTILTGWHGKSPRLWLVSRDGLAVDDGEPGDPSISALTGSDPGAGLRAPGPAHHVGGPRRRRRDTR